MVFLSDGLLDAAVDFSTVRILLVVLQALAGRKKYYNWMLCLSILGLFVWLMAVCSTAAEWRISPWSGLNWY